MWRRSPPFRRCPASSALASSARSCRVSARCGRPSCKGSSARRSAYVTACATVLVLGLVIDLLAPMFGSRRSFRARVQARSLFLYAVLARRDLSARAGLALPDRAELLRRLSVVERLAAADGDAASEGSCLYGGDRRLRRRADADLRRRAARAVWSDGALTAAGVRNRAQGAYGAISTWRQAGGNVRQSSAPASASPAR